MFHYIRSKSSKTASSRLCHSQNMTTEIQDLPPQNMQFGYIKRPSRAPVFCLKTDSVPHKELSAHKLLPRSFISREDWFLLQKRRLEMDTLPRQTLSRTTVPPTYSSKGPFVTPQNHVPKRCMSSLPFSLLGRQFKCDFCATGGVTCFSLGLCQEHMRYTP